MHSAILTRMLILAAGVVLDLLIGDPLWLPHPVMGVGRVISLTEQLLWKCMRLPEDPGAARGRKRAAGLLLAIAVIALSLGPVLLLFYIMDHLCPPAGIACRIILTWQILAARSLADAAERVRRPLADGRTEEAREAVSMIVGRDTGSLTPEGIAKAACETVAENTNDGVVAPLLWLLVSGTAGGWLWKIINTLDSMVGYRNDRYRDFGTVSARLDDIAAFLPARTAGLAMTAAAFILGCVYGRTEYDGKNAWRIFRRDRLAHKSPNSGHTEAACAGALHVAFGGSASYFGQRVDKPVIGDPDRPVCPEDIRRSEALMLAASGLVFVAGELLLLLFGSILS